VSRLFARAAASLDARLEDRELHPDVTAAYALLEDWSSVT
jgi:hypothetical protein